MSGNPLFEKYGQTYRDGQVLFREGDVGDRMYIIQTGQIRITKTIDGKEHDLATLGKGEFFGEMAIVRNETRSAAATAVGAVEALAFDREGFEAMIEKNVKIAMSVVDKFCRRLDNTTDQVQTLVRQNQRSMVALNLLNRYLEDAEPEEKVLSVDRTVAEVSETLGYLPEVVERVLNEFDQAKVCKIDGNAIRLRSKSGLVTLKGLS